MILEHELKSHETSFDNLGLFSNFTYVEMKGPNKQLSNESIKFRKSNAWKVKNSLSTGTRFNNLKQFELITH